MQFSMFTIFASRYMSVKKRDRIDDLVHAVVLLFFAALGPGLYSASNVNQYQKH
jgi:hypothetical protein